MVTVFLGHECGKGIVDMVFLSTLVTETSAGKTRALEWLDANVIWSPLC